MRSGVASRIGVMMMLALLASAGRVAGGPVDLPDGSRIEKVDFERHVQGLLGRLGCNSGACHGSFQGKGGLYLSLFGYSPEKDYVAFTRTGMGRRISVNSPDSSLILLKASGQVPHEGGKRMDRDSWQYRVFREWIADGASWQPGSGNVKRMDVLPKEHLLSGPGEQGRSKVIVEFSDGAKEDLTYFSEFRVSDDFIAESGKNTGEVRSVRAGHTAVIVTYRGHIDAAHVLVKLPAAPGFVYPQVPEVNYIDREVFGKLKKLNIVPSELSGDAEFLRRVTIDTIGQLPTPDEVRAFLADKDSDKRVKRIDALLRHPLHAALWATKFSDITGNNVDALEQPVQARTRRAKMWHDWFRKRVTENMPYDQIVKGVLCATSRDGMPVEDWAKQAVEIELSALKGFQSDYANRASLDLFWRRTPFTREQMAEQTAAAFLGVRLECAQCHKHPFDRWTQDDYHAYANIFTQIRFVPSPEGQSVWNKILTERKKELSEALAKVDQEFAERKKAITDPIDKEHLEKRPAAEAKIDSDIAEKRKALEAKLANDDAEKRRLALAKFDKDQVNVRKSALAKFDQQNNARKQQALAVINKEIQVKKAEAQAKHPLPNPQLREVTFGTAPPPKKGANSYPDLLPKTLGGPRVELTGDRRVGLFEWMAKPDNAFFARSFVNRVWAHYFGVGLVDPVDNFSVANPPSNEKLLDALAKDFIDHKYDIRHLERTVLLSRAYQLSAKPNDTNKQDRNLHSRSYPRRMMAEVVVDVLNGALGVTENFGPEVPPGVKAVEVAPNRLQQSPTLTNVFRLFGRPLRTSTCDCERASEPALPQVLYLMTDPAVLTRINDGRLKSLLASKKSDEEVVEELYLATLSRLPTARERERLVKYVASRPSRQAGFVDVTWALINAKEFILNH